MSVPVISDEEFMQAMHRLGPFEAAPEIAVAFSGGRDSLALLLLASRWAGNRGGKVTALIVDHRLRLESASEASQAAAHCRAIGVVARILVWDHDFVATGIQRRARVARYELLDQACGELGILHLLVAHHAGDQAETVVMRRERGSGAIGLSGMSAIVELENCRCLRPLLSFSRARLEAVVAESGLPWIDDPSNLKKKYWRGRYRTAGVPSLPLPGSRRRLNLEQRVAAFLAQRLWVFPLGLARLDAGDGAIGASDEVAWQSLRLLTRAISGKAYAPPPASASRALARLVGGDADMTLGGCHVVRHHERIHVIKERRQIGQKTGPVLTQPAGGRAIWDDRWAIACPEDEGSQFEVWPAPTDKLLANCAESIAASVPQRRRVLAAMPWFRIARESSMNGSLHPCGLAGVGELKSVPECYFRARKPVLGALFVQ